jgi:hypothetical protein
MPNAPCCGREPAEKGTSVTVRKGKRTQGGKRGASRPKGTVTEPETARSPERKQAFVDIDPWAVLLEQRYAAPGAGRGEQQ